MENMPTIDDDAARAFDDAINSTIEEAEAARAEAEANYRAAVDWRSKGYNVVPQKAPDKKHPGVEWKHLQDRLVTDAELVSLRRMFANGLGFITGAISGVVVVESDGLAGLTVLDEFEAQHGPLPQTLTIQSGSGRGFHLHYRHPGHRVKTIANPNIQLDIKGDGGFCVLPPSLHKSGGRYEIVHDVEPAELPQGLLEFIADKATQASAAKTSLQPSGDPNPVPAIDSPFGNNTAKVFDGPPLPPQEMRAMLEHLAKLNYFEHRNGIKTDADGRIIKIGWIECGMALKLAYGDEVGFELWSITHIDDRARSDAPAQWASFASETSQ